MRDATAACNIYRDIMLPAWEDLFNGVRPPAPSKSEDTIGEWTHGWQYHASNSYETAAFDRLLCVLGLPNIRRSAKSVGKSPLYSIRGEFSSHWLIICPTSAMVRFSNAQFSML